MVNINVAIIGAGRWGKNHVKTANNLLKPDQITVCDFAVKAKEVIDGINPDIKFTTDFESIINNEDINAVVISTPAETHFEVAKKCIEAGKHCLVEKPITLRSEDAEELNELADRNNVKLMVGHVLLYHPAVSKMKSEIVNGKIGKLQYIYSNRLNLGAIRSEENSLWSFAPHDISIIQLLVENNPEDVNANGGDYVRNGIEDSTLTFLTYPGNVKAHIFVSWLHPFKEQRMVVIGDKGMFVFEDSAKDEKLKFYEKGFKNVNGTIEKFDSEYEVIEFEPAMPLTEEHKHFYDCVVNNKKPLTDGVHALEVLKILEKATGSLSN